MHTALRRLVVQSNRARPLAQLNRAAYRAAIRTFVLAVRSFAEIRSIHLRHSLVGHEWVPGLSDIDLTVVCRHRGDATSEAAFLRRFWHRFDRLKTYLPMLGELDVLTEDQLPSWTRYTIRGYEAETWELIHGGPPVSTTYGGAEGDRARDGLNHAITTYVERFLPRFYAEDRSDSIAARGLERLARKVSRYTWDGRPRGEPVRLDQTPEPGDVLLVRLLRELDERAAELVAGGTDRARQPLAPAVVDRENCWRAGPETHRREVESVLKVGARLFVLLRCDRPRADLERCSRAVRRLSAHTRQNDPMPVVVSRALFAFMTRLRFGPYFYPQLSVRRTIMAGDDPLTTAAEPVIRPPTTTEAGRCFTDQTGNLLAYPRSREVTRATQSEPCRPLPLRTLLKRALFLRLYLDTSRIETSYDENLSACRRRYPDAWRRLDELEGDARAPAGAAGVSTVAWLRALGEGVHQSVAAASKAGLW